LALHREHYAGIDYLSSSVTHVTSQRVFPAFSLADQRR